MIFIAHLNFKFKSIVFNNQNSLDMLSDPPHKKGYHTTIPQGYSFVRWNDLNNYKQQVQEIHANNEQMDEIERKRRYKEELDRLVNIKQMKERKDAKNEQFAHETFVKDLNYYDAYECEKNRRAAMFEREMLYESEKNREELKKQQAEHKNLENARHEAMLRQSLEVQQMERYKNDNLRQMYNYERTANYNDELRRKNEEKIKEKINDKKCSEAEKQLITKMEAENREFYDRIRNVDKYNKPALDLYTKLYTNNKEKAQALDFYTIDKPYFERIRKELDEEVRDLEKRKGMQKDHGNFIQHQLENARLKKEALQYEQQKQEYLALQKQLEEQNIKDQTFTEQYKNKLKDNLNVLKDQMEENKAKLFFEDLLNINEAQINQTAITKLNYHGNNSDTLCGVPGMGLAHERKHQLKVIDNNISQDDRHINEKFKRGSEQFSENLVPLGTTKKFANYDFAKNGSNVLTKENNSMIPHGYSNEYDYIRGKNIAKPFNIISNQFMPK